MNYPKHGLKKLYRPPYSCKNDFMVELERIGKEKETMIRTMIQRINTRPKTIKTK